MHFRKLALFEIVFTAVVVAQTHGATESGTPSDQHAAKPATATPLMAKRTVPIEGRFGEGWRQTVALPDSALLGAGGQVTLAVEKGWLSARRDAADGQVEWHIVLCQASEQVLPAIEVMEGVPNFVDISYRDGRYFARDGQGLLRVLREVGTNDRLVTRDSLLSTNAKISGYGMAPKLGVTCSSWIDNDWYFIASGPEKELWRLLVRLNPMDEDDKRGYGVRSSVSYIHQTHGDKWLVDDGELMVASRMTVANYDAIKKERAAREAILAGQMPDIDATGWLNTTDAPTWNALHGKVVLVDFWATWCGPCVAKLPSLQQLHEKYGERGLVVVGIHSAQDAETCAGFLKEKGYTSPVALDSGKTAEAFAVTGWPTYFLLDRTGKVVQGFQHEPPSEEVIESLLNSVEP